MEYAIRARDIKVGDVISYVNARFNQEVHGVESSRFGEVKLELSYIGGEPGTIEWRNENELVYILR